MTSFAKLMAAGAAGAILLATAGMAGSHAAKSSNAAVAARHFQMQMVGYHIGILGAIAKGEMEYSAEQVDAAAHNLAHLARMEQATLWVEGTEQGAADKSRAKAEIWQKPDEFDAKFEALAEASMALVGAADAAAVGAGMGKLGGTCKDCHETFRGPKNE